MAKKRPQHREGQREDGAAAEKGRVGLRGSKNIVYKRRGKKTEKRVEIPVERRDRRLVTESIIVHSSVLTWWPKELRLTKKPKSMSHRKPGCQGSARIQILLTFPFLSNL